MANKVEVIVTVRDNASSSLRGITGSLSSMASVAGGIVVADVLGRIGSGLLAVGQAGFDGARGIENATARLNAFTKDTAVSTQILNDLRMEASKTPFAFGEMADAGASLLPVANQLNMDLMDLVQTAEILAASNPAEGLAGAAFALKEAASGDFTSIVERFNLSRSAIQALKDEGVPNLEIVARAMADAGLDMDLVSNMANTFDGRMSTLIDTFREVAIAFATPIFGVISEGLAGAQVSLNEAMPFLLETAAKWGQLAADSITTFKEAWSGDWEDDEIIQPVHRFVGKTADAIKGMWDGLVKLGNENLPKVLAAWEETAREFQELNRAADDWNQLVEESNRLMDVLQEAFGNTAGQAKEANKQLTGTIGIGDRLGQLFNNTAKELRAVADAIVWLRTQLAGFIQDASDAAAAGVQAAADVTGAAIGAGASAAAGASTGAGVGSAPVDSPGTSSGGGIAPSNSQGATTSGGTGGRGQTTIAQPMVAGAGSNIFYMTVNNALDIEEVAYRVAEIIQSRRSDT